MRSAWLGLLSKKIVRGVAKYSVRKSGWNRFVWVGAKGLPDVVVKACETLRGE
jgi:hypothetical protein